MENDSQELTKKERRELKRQGKNFFFSSISIVDFQNKKSILAIIFFSLIFISGIGFYLWQENSTTIDNALNAQSPTPVFLYTEEISRTPIINGRSWPTWRIFRKVGDNEPEVLADVGKVGEYPRKYQLNSDHTSLLINLESKLQILDLTTGELQDLFVPKEKIVSATYSPDETQLFIVDWKGGRKSDGTYNSFYIHRFTISNQEDEILYQKHGEDLGSRDPIIGSLYGRAWREDGKVVLSEANGDFSVPYYFDLASNQIFRTPEVHTVSPGVPFSADGQFMTVTKERVSIECDDFGGGKPSIYSITDTVSGEIFGEVGLQDYEVIIIGFSPDNTEALYSVSKPWINREDCNKIPSRTYFKVKIDGGQAIPIEDPAELVLAWNIKDIVGFSQVDFDDSDREKRIFSISINGQTVITSNAALNVVGEYYQPS